MISLFNISIILLNEGELSTPLYLIEIIEKKNYRYTQQKLC